MSIEKNGFVCRFCEHAYDKTWNCCACTEFSLFSPRKATNTQRNKGYISAADLRDIARKMTGVGVVYQAPGIKKVHFNDPVTVVIWTDGTKTIVRCQEGDVFDPEKGLAMAISKKYFGNKGNYCEVFKKWVPEPEPIYPNIVGPRVMCDGHTLKEIMDSVIDKKKKSKDKKNKE